MKLVYLEQQTSLYFLPENHHHQVRQIDEVLICGNVPQAVSQIADIIQ